MRQAIIASPECSSWYANQNRNWPRALVNYGPAKNNICPIISRWRPGKVYRLTDLLSGEPGICENKRLRRMSGDRSCQNRSTKTHPLSASANQRASSHVEKGIKFTPKAQHFCFLGCSHDILNCIKIQLLRTGTAPTIFLSTSLGYTVLYFKFRYMSIKL